jgi:hypothetical protein
MIQQSQVDPTMVNGNGAAEVAGQPEVDEVAQPEASGSNEAPKSYDDLFPSLPVSAQPSSAGAGAPGAWGAKRPVFASSTVTQVFR